MKRCFYLLIIVFWGCQSPSDKIVDEFKRIDRSLDSNSGNIESANRQLQLALQNDSGLAAIKAETTSVFEIIERAKQKIKEAAGKNGSDEALMDLTASNKVMLNEKRTDSVFFSLKKFQNLVLLKCTEDSVKLQINQKFQYLKTIKNLNETFFKNTPSVAAVTMLSKFQNDVKNIENIVFMSVLNKKE